MAEQNEKTFQSGVLDSINGQTVSFRAQVQFNKQKQPTVTVFDVTREYADLLSKSDECYGALFLDQDQYLNLFGIHVRKQSAIFGPNTDMESVTFTLTLVSDAYVLGPRPLSCDISFPEFVLKITDGHELIGICPYDLNDNYINLLSGKNICIPTKKTIRHLSTAFGDLSFNVLPTHSFSNDSLQLSFDHLIWFRPCKSLNYSELYNVLKLFTDYYSILCDELVTINQLTAIVCDTDNRSEQFDFLFFSNYPIQHLRLLTNEGNFDSACYLRRSIAKLSDFIDLEKSVEKWQSKEFRSKDMLLAIDAYKRILLDEDANLMTSNSFLAAMQMVEGYVSALYGKKKARADFDEQRDRIIDQLQNEEDKQFITDNIVSSGYVFREALQQFLTDGLSVFKDISLDEVCDKYKELISKLVKERNRYTHSSKEIKEQFTYNELFEVTFLFKELFRALILFQLGLSYEQIKYRLSFNRAFVSFMENIFVIDIEPASGEDLNPFDSEMHHFSS